MTDFSFSASAEPITPADIVTKFLNTVDPHELGSEALNSMGWGDDDPICIALQILKDRAAKWS